MKFSVLIFIMAFTLFMWPAYAEDTLTGDTRLACEALLCLSSGTQPGECGPSLSRYFGISHKKWKDTVKARRNFLNQCPTVSEDPSIPTLVKAILNGAGRYTAELPNRQLQRHRQPHDEARASEKAFQHRFQYGWRQARGHFKKISQGMIHAGHEAETDAPPASGRTNSLILRSSPL